MDWLLFLKGLGIGLALAIPVGPIGLLVFRRSVAHGARSGITTGLGAALADALLCGIMAFGITTVAEFIKDHADFLNRFGGIALILIGYIIFRSAPPKELTSAPKRRGWFGAFSTALLLTISNPATILGVTGIFAGFGIAAHVGKAFRATLLVLGVFGGSMLWWCILSNLASLLRDKTSGYWMRRINQGCGIALVVFGAISLVFRFFG
jgi:threonine/homoserine/homoserine lactone efflux protein